MHEWRKPCYIETSRAITTAAIAIWRLGMALNESAAYCQSARQHLQSGSYDQGISLLQAALARDARCFEAYELLGYAYSCKRMPDAAVQALSAATGLRPAYNPVRMNLAIALQQAGRLQEAVSQLQYVVAQDPANSNAQQHLATLQSHLAAQRATPAYPPQAPHPGGYSPGYGVAPQPPSSYSSQSYNPSPGYHPSYGTPGYSAGYLPYTGQTGPPISGYGVDTNGWSPSNIGRILTAPVAFFQEQASIRGFAQPLIFYIILLMPTLILTVINASSRAPAGQGGAFMAGAAIGMVFGLAIGLAVFLAIVGFFHLFCMMFGGRGGYEGTMRAIVYGAVPFLLINMVGTAAQLASPGPAIFFGLFSLCGMVWAFILMVIGFREIHGISTGSALGAAIIPAIILFVVLFVIGFMLGVAMMGAAMSHMGGTAGSTGFPGNSPNFPGSPQGFPGGFPRGPSGPSGGFPGGFPGSQ